MGANRLISSEAVLGLPEYQVTVIEETGRQIRGNGSAGAAGAASGSVSPACGQRAVSAQRVPEALRWPQPQPPRLAGKLASATIERWFANWLQQLALERTSPQCPQVLGIDEHFFRP